jgi:hypothetical protein
MTTRDGADDYHFAVAVHDRAAKQSDFVSGGTGEVLPLEVVAETA